MRHVNLVRLYDDNREKLLLNWQIGQNADRRIEIKGSNNYGADLVGHINIIHPERLQVLGMAEYDWAMRISERRFGQMFTDLLNAKPPAVIVADGLTPPPMVAEACVQSGTPLIVSPKPCSAVIDLLRLYLSARLADTISLHGVFMDVLGMGVLITGDSGIVYKYEDAKFPICGNSYKIRRTWIFYDWCTKLDTQCALDKNIRSRWSYRRLS